MLSATLSKHVVTPSTEIALFDAQGNAVAYPDSSRLIVDDSTAHLVKAADLSPSLHALLSDAPTANRLEADGVKYKAGTFPFLANGRARALGDTTGMVKFLADATTDEILGVHIVGPMASELISEAVVAMEFKASAEDIARICHAHPSLSEATKEAALAVDKRTLNF